MRDKIEEKLKELGEAVFYGSGKFKGRDIWEKKNQKNRNFG